MAYEWFELAEPTILKRDYEKLRGILASRFDPEKASREAAVLLEALSKFKPEPIETPKNIPPIFLIRARGKAVIFVVVYPNQYTVYTSDSMAVVEYLLDEYVPSKGIGDYIVILFYSRRGKLGPAAYLYLGMVIEVRGVGILFINGGPSEVVEVIDKLIREGRYEPEEEVVVDLA